MKVEQEKLLRINKEIEHLLSYHQDQRLQMGIKNVQTACMHHLNYGIPITISSLAEFIAANCGGKPARGTINNDSKGIYKPIIDIYSSAYSVPHKKNKNKTTTSENSPQQTIYVNQLENRVKHLEKVLDQNFKNQGSISLSSMLNSQVDELGSVDVVPSSKFSKAEKDAIQKLLGLINLTDDFTLDGQAGRERVIGVTKKVLISPSELITIKNIIQD